jgi:general secretion pathway protein H
MNREGYRFSRSEHAEWLPEREGELRPRKWSAAPDLVLTRDDQRVAIGAEFPDKPQLVCFSSGELTAFRLDLALADASAHFRVYGEPDGVVRVATVDVRAR